VTRDAAGRHTECKQGGINGAAFGGRVLTPVSTFGLGISIKLARLSPSTTSARRLGSITVVVSAANAEGGLANRAGDLIFGVSGKLAQVRIWRATTRWRSD
jgi:hypothetical protein